MMLAQDNIIFYFGYWLLKMASEARNTIRQMDFCLLYFKQEFKSSIQLICSSAKAILCLKVTPPEGKITVKKVKYIVQQAMTTHKEKRNRNWQKFSKSEQGTYISPYQRNLMKSVKMVRGGTCHSLLGCSYLKSTTQLTF